MDHYNREPITVFIHTKLAVSIQNNVVLHCFVEEMMQYVYTDRHVEETVNNVILLWTRVGDVVVIGRR